MLNLIYILCYINILYGTQLLEHNNSSHIVKGSLSFNSTGQLVHSFLKLLLSVKLVAMCAHNWSALFKLINDKVENIVGGDNCSPEWYPITDFE